MIMVFPVAQIGIQILPQFRGALVDLHGSKLVPMLEVLLELRRGTSHFRVFLSRKQKLERYVVRCQETPRSTPHLVG